MSDQNAYAEQQVVFPSVVNHLLHPRGYDLFRLVLGQFERIETRILDRVDGWIHGDLGLTTDDEEDAVSSFTLLAKIRVVGYDVTFKAETEQFFHLGRL